MKKILSIFFFLALAYFTYVSNSTYAASGTLALSPSQGSYTTGSNFDVDIILNTGGAAVSGTDIALTFDNAKLRLLDISNGTIFTQYIGKEINNANGTALLSGIANTQADLYTGTGVFATLRFQAVSAGTAQVGFVFTAGDRNDSNIAELATQSDILTSVANGSYVISGGSVNNTTNNTTNNNTNRTMPATANEFPFYLLISLGALVIGFGSYKLIRTKYLLKK